MKKFLAILLALVMVLAIAACDQTGDDVKDPDGTVSGGEKDPAENPPEGSGGEENPPEVVDPEPLPATALNHWDFESAEGLSTLHQVPRPVDSELTGVTTSQFDVVESKHEIMFADGPVGKAAYLDGKYGIKLDMTAPTDDSYTIAFWYNGDRFITFGPIVTMGRNVGMANSTDPATAVCWFNFTSTTWGPDGASICPVAWNRNSSIPWSNDENGVFPWVGADNTYGKKEWTHVALVVDGNRYTCPDDNGERIGTKLYLNGQLFFDASAENLYYQGVAPEIFQHLDTAIRGLEAYVGINYWDACYKGFIDDLYIYDEALTAGQVLSLYQMGDATVASVAPEYTGPTDDGESEAPAPAEPIDPATLTAAPVNANAIDVLGTPDRVCGFFVDNTDTFAIEEGKTTTLTFHNYSNGVANWNNFSVGFCANEFTTDKVANGDPAVCTVEGYTEYGVQRADAYGWGAEGFAQTSTMSWTDWVAWLNLMTDADVTLKMTRAANVVTMDFTFTGADGTVMTEQSVVTLGAAADAPINAFLVGDGCYIELLSAVTE